jgi:hypothetical protein
MALARTVRAFPLPEQVCYLAVQSLDVAGIERILQRERTSKSPNWRTSVTLLTGCVGFVILLPSRQQLPHMTGPHAASSVRPLFFACGPGFAICRVRPACSPGRLHDATLDDPKNVARGLASAGHAIAVLPQFPK